MKTTVVTAALAMLCASQAMAAPQTYLLDPEHTFPRLSYNHLGISTQLLRFNRTSGKVVFDRQARQAEVDVTIDMTSVDSGMEKFNEHLQSDEFLDTAKFPTATFRSTNVTFDGDRPASIDGELTIRGITRPVTLTVTSFFNGMHPMMKKEAIGGNATGTIRRSEFGAGKYAPHVSDEVALEISFEAAIQ